jgi:hypothetical protein
MIYGVKFDIDLRMYRVLLFILNVFGYTFI